METIASKNEQTEISLRTLSSDLSSVEKGSLSPTSELLQVTMKRMPDESTDTPPATHKGFRSFIMAIFFLVIVAAFYFYVYPLLQAALTSPASVR